MSHLKNTGFSDRISAAAEAKKAMLAKMKPKPTVTDPDFDKREQLRAAELDAVRAARADAREAVRLAQLAKQEVILAAKRAERKERKTDAAAEQKMRKEEKAAQREQLRSLGRTSKSARAHEWGSLIG